MPDSAPRATNEDLAEYALRLGDDALVLAQRLCAWVTRAPTIEEDLALSNLALDLLGHARTLLSWCGRLEGDGRGEDDLAYGRAAEEYRNALLVELPNGDFAATVARQLVHAHWTGLLYESLASSSDPDLAAFGARAAKDAEYHRMHADGWTVRLGRGTAESRRRMTAGLGRVWPYAAELFETDALTGRLAAAGAAPAPAALRDRWEREVAAVLADAGLDVPAPQWAATGGRSGRHSPELAPLLAELRSVREAFPGGVW